MGLLSRIRVRLQRSGTQADKLGVYFNSHTPAHKPGYYLNQESMHRMKSHRCNSACDIDTLRHWIQ